MHLLDLCALPFEVSWLASDAGGVKVACMHACTASRLQFDMFTCCSAASSAGCSAQQQYSRQLCGGTVGTASWRTGGTGCTGPQHVAGYCTGRLVLSGGNLQQCLAAGNLQQCCAVCVLLHAKCTLAAVLTWCSCSFGFTSACSADTVVLGLMQANGVSQCTSVDDPGCQHGVDVRG